MVTIVASSNFNDKWKMGFVNSFTGPAPTIWTGEQVSIETIDGSNRAVVLQADEENIDGKRTLKCGMISTFEKSSFPLFQEARIKISNSQLANAIWMLSGDNGTTEEIDNVEAYGPRLRPDGSVAERAYFSDRIHLSHHTFINRNGERLDYQPKDDTWMSRKKSLDNCDRSNDVTWSEDYHYFGVKWTSATRLEYFVDGVRVRVVDGLNEANGIDPLGYIHCGEGLAREMHSIISQAAQVWRYGSIDNFWNSTDIKTGDNTKLRVDWIRVYTPTGTPNRRDCNL